MEKNITDILLEEMEIEIYEGTKVEDNSFDTFLESMNANVLLTETPLDDAMAKDKADKTTATATPASSTATATPAASTTTAAPDANTTAPADGAAAAPTAVGLKDKIFNAVKDISGKVGGFVETQLTKISEGLNKLQTTVNTNPKAMLVNDISLSAISLFKIPNQIFKADQSIANTFSLFSKYVGGTKLGSKGPVKTIMNTANQLLGNPKNPEEGFGQKILNACTSLMKGLTGAFTGIAGAFATMWTGIKNSLGIKKTESYEVKDDGATLALQEAINLLDTI